jgi:hypothetical protein
MTAPAWPVLSESGHAEQQPRRRWGSSFAAQTTAFLRGRAADFRILGPEQQSPDGKSRSCAPRTSKSSPRTTASGSRATTRIQSATRPRRRSGDRSRSSDREPSAAFRYRPGVRRPHAHRRVPVRARIWAGRVAYRSARRRLFCGPSRSAPPSAAVAGRRPKRNPEVALSPVKSFVVV